MLFWDGVLRGSAAGLLALLIVLFVRDGRRTLTGRLGVLLSLSGLAYLVLPTLDYANDGTWWRLLVHISTLSGPGLFWLFAASWFDDDFTLRVHHAMALAASVLLGLISDYGAVSRAMHILLLDILWRLSAIGMVAAGIVISLRGRQNDLVETRRRTRLVLSTAIGLVIVWVVLAELPLKGWPPPLEWRLINSAGLFALAATLTVTITGWRDPGLLAPVRTPTLAGPRAEADDSQLLARLDNEMKRERLYRQNGLTIASVAARLGVPEYRLRRAINQGLGERNFNAYLNGFRLAEVREALADPAQRETPILTIALDAGFGSLAPFNRAFRAAENCTPTEYRARCSGQA